MAVTRKNTKMSQNTSRAIPPDGLAPGRTASTYRLASLCWTFWSTPTFSSTLRTTPATTFAIT